MSRMKCMKRLSLLSTSGAARGYHKVFAPTPLWVGNPYLIR